MTLTRQDAKLLGYIKRFFRRSSNFKKKCDHNDNRNKYIY